MRARPRGRRRRLGCSRGRASCCLTRSSNSASHSSMGRLIWGRGARGSSGQMRGRSGRMASGGGSASVGSGSTAISGGRSDICRNLSGGWFRHRSGLGPVQKEAAPEAVESADHRRTEQREQHHVAGRAEAVVGERGREVEPTEAAKQGRQADPGRPAQR